MRREPYTLGHISDDFKTQEICEKAVEVNAWRLYVVPDHFKNQEVGNKAIEADPYKLKDVPDWFVTQQQIDIWYDDDYFCHDDEIIEWYEGYKVW